MSIVTFMSKNSKIDGSTKVSFTVMHGSDIVLLFACMIEKCLIVYDVFDADIPVYVSNAIYEGCRMFSNVIIAAISLDRAMSVARPAFFRTKMTKSTRYVVLVVTFSALFAILTRSTLVIPSYRGKTIP